jgi:hypothetical protein
MKLSPMSVGRKLRLTLALLRTPVLKCLLVNLRKMSVWWGFSSPSHPHKKQPCNGLPVWFSYVIPLLVVVVDHCRHHNNDNSSSDSGYQKAKVKVKAVLWFLQPKVHVLLEEAGHLAGNCRFGNEASLVCVPSAKSSTAC